MASFFRAPVMPSLLMTTPCLSLFARSEVPSGQLCHLTHTASINPVCGMSAIGTILIACYNFNWPDLCREFTEAELIPLLR